jgi:hypothetical protein
MLFQVLAMWLVVGATIVWFLRDERARRDSALSAQALRFAQAPHYRHPTPPEPAQSQADRAFLANLLDARTPQARR